MSRDTSALQKRNKGQSIVTYSISSREQFSGGTNAFFATRMPANYEIGFCTSDQIKICY